MKVYILISSYFDGAEYWNNIVNIYANVDDAELAKLELDEKNDDVEHDSWYVETHNVL